MSLVPGMLPNELDGYLPINDAQVMFLWERSKHDIMQLVLDYWRMELDAHSSISAFMKVAGSTIYLPKNIQNFCQQVANQLLNTGVSAVAEFFTYGMYVVLVNKDASESGPIIDPATSQKIDEIIKKSVQNKEDSGIDPIFKKEKDPVFNTADIDINLNHQFVEVLPMHTLQVFFKKNPDRSQYEFRVFTKPQTQLGQMMTNSWRELKDAVVCFDHSTITPEGFLNSMFSSVAHRLLYSEWLSVAFMTSVAVRSRPNTVEETPLPKMQLAETYQPDQEDLDNQMEQYRRVQTAITIDSITHNQRNYESALKWSSNQAQDDPNWAMLAGQNPLLASAAMQGSAPGALPFIRKPYMPRPGNVVRNIPTEQLPAGTLEMERSMVEQFLARFALSGSKISGKIGGNHTNATTQMMMETERRFGNKCRQVFRPHLNDIILDLIEDQLKQLLNSIIAHILEELGDEDNTVLAEQLAQQSVFSIRFTPLHSSNMTSEDIREFREQGYLSFEMCRHIALEMKGFDPDASQMEEPQEDDDKDPQNPPAKKQRTSTK